MADQKHLFFMLVYTMHGYPIMALLGIVGSLAVLCIVLGRIHYLRLFYEQQGVIFVQNSYPLIGAELKVSELRRKNKSHDWLYKNGRADLIGTIRGLSIQLYGMTGEICDQLLRQTGRTVDRDSPALFSFGRLSPFAITFIPMSKPLFKQRKTNLIRALNDMKRLHQIAENQTSKVLAEFNMSGGAKAVDVRELLNHWARATSGEFIWGPRILSRTVRAYNATGQLTKIPLMTALNHTFTDLRFYSTNFWTRIYFPLAAWPITREARRLTYNIRTLQEEFNDILAIPEEGSVAERIKKDNDAMGISFETTRDDIITATVGGLDTVKSASMVTLWNLLQPDNKQWKDRVISELMRQENVHNPLADVEALTAAILESLRLEPPGSLMNNRATTDFELSLPNKSYKIKAGTRIVPCIHALHKNSNCWITESRPDMKGLDRFDPSRFTRWGNDIVGSSYFLPWGSGPRRCPGQAIGLSMVKSFVAAFLRRYGECDIALPRDQSPDDTCFNILSKATFLVQSDTKPTVEMAVEI